MTRNPDTQKLKNENKLLKAELRLYQDSHSHSGHFRSHQNTSRTESRGSNPSGNWQDGAAEGIAGIPHRESSVRTSRKGQVSLNRHNSTGAVEQWPSEERSTSVSSGQRSSFGFTIGNPGTALAQSTVDNKLVVPNGQQYPANGNFSVPPTKTVSRTNSTKDEGKWIHRFRELERRLKTEREQRLVDRDGARRRLEERDEQNKRLARELENERASRGWKADHADGYLIGDEPMLDDFVGGFNRQQEAADEQISDAQDDEVTAQPPTVGSSHAQRVLQAHQRKFEKIIAQKPESIRAVSRGSAMSNSPRRPGSLKDRISGRTASMYSEGSRMEFIGTGERWGRNGCEKEIAVPVDEDQSIRRISRSQSAYTGTGMS